MRGDYAILKLSRRLRIFTPGGSPSFLQKRLAFPEAKGAIALFAEAERKEVVYRYRRRRGEIGRRLKTDGELRQVTEDYLAKREKVSFSDPALRRQDRCSDRRRGVAVCRVDYWNYTTENDKKVGKVSLNITMIEARTGKTLWTAVHKG